MRGSLFRAAAVAVAVGLALASGWGALGNRSGRAWIAELVQAASGRRLVEARLSGGFVWAPLEPGNLPERTLADTDRTVRGPAAPAADQDRWRIAAVATRLTDDHALGIAHLLLGSTEDAVGALEAAAEDAPEDAAVLSDLAAALLTRGRTPEHARDLIRALDLTEQALVMAPRLPEAWFNRALAVEELGLREAAIVAWEAYVGHDPAGPWAEEARTRATRLSQAPREPAWEPAPFLSACARNDRKSAEGAFRRHPQQATETVLDTLLPEWARHEMAGDPAAARSALAALDCAGEVMARASGDFMVADAVREIRGLRVPRVYAMACLKLAKGRETLDSLDAAAAQAPLREARATLASARSSLADLAALNEIVSQFYLGDAVGLEAQALALRAERVSHGNVAAKARWLAGMADYSQGQWAPAVTSLQLARAGLERLGFAGDATFVRSIEASVWRWLGRDERAWSENLAVFASLDAIPDPRRAQALLGAASAQTQLEGFPLAAIVLQEASLAFAARHDSVVDLVDGQVWLARVAARAGRRAQAERALEAARGGLGNLPGLGVSQRLTAEVALVEAGLLAADHPERAERQATAAEDYFARVGNPARLVESRLARARAHQAAGRSQDAERDYLAALDAVETQRNALGDPALRLSFFEVAKDLARELVGFEWSWGRREQALLLADRMRGRTLVEARSPRLEDVRAFIGPSEAVLFYAVLQDRTVAWVLRRDDVQSVELPLSEHDLQPRVRAWRSATLTSDRKRAAAAAEWLFAKLVTPAQPFLAGARVVIVVPDGPLHRVAWGSLRDPASGRVWAEQAAIAVAPCLPIGRGLQRREPPRRAVVVGNPAFDRTAFPALPDLPGAAREAIEVASAYPEAELLMGVDATAARVLDAAERADVLHVAAHGVVDAVDEERSALVLAPGGALAPTGALRSSSIRGRRLEKLELVVLAACRSGDGPLSRLEGPLSLARPFLEAGAGAVLTSLFDLPDRGAAVGTIHAHLRKTGSPVEAFRRATVACWRAPSPDPLTCGGLELIVHPEASTGGE